MEIIASVGCKKITQICQHICGSGFAKCFTHAKNSVEVFFSILDGYYSCKIWKLVILALEAYDYWAKLIRNCLRI